ncbi:homocysteine S-methyltransferase family protein [Chloroflexota bacterium]
MAEFLQRLKTEVLISEGAMSTNLAMGGFDQTGNAAYWVTNHPDVYQDLLKAFFNVGCDISTTYTSASNRFRLKPFGLEDKAREINYKVARLTKEVTPSTCYLGFSLSATAVFLPPMGNASPDEVYESYVEQVVIAEDVGVDFFQIHGSDIEQTGLAVKAVKDNSKLPVAVLLHSINPTPKGFRTMMGVSPTMGATKFQEFGADVIGQTCGGINYEESTAVLKEMRAACSKPLWARPNAGIPELVDGKAVHPATPEQMVEEAPKWVEAGARIVGGCCGTTLEHMAKVVAVLK